jgi:hypothetical protein
VKSNGVKRAFEDESRKSPDHDDMSSDGESSLADARMETDGDKDEEMNLQGHPPVEESDGEESVLQYSVFGEKKESSRRNVDTSKKPRRRSGPYGTDDDEALEPEQPKKPSKTRSGRTTRATQKVTAAAPSKPPAKKVKQTADVVRHIPGGLMEEEEEDEDEDQLATLPTRISRHSSRAGKGKAASVDTTDEMEGGVQTRRRSSRLSAAGSSGYVRAGSPELVSAPKTRRAGRPSAASKKKR